MISFLNVLKQLDCTLNIKLHLSKIYISKRRPPGNFILRILFFFFKLYECFVKIILSIWFGNCDIFQLVAGQQFTSVYAEVLLLVRPPFNLVMVTGSSLQAFAQLATSDLSLVIVTLVNDMSASFLNILTEKYFANVKNNHALCYRHVRMDAFLMLVLFRNYSGIKQSILQQHSNFQNFRCNFKKK